MTMSQDQVRETLSEAGGSFDALVLGGVPGRTVVEWGGAWLETSYGQDVLSINLCTSDADGTCLSSDLEIAMRPDGPVIVGINGRNFRGVAPASEPVTLWRIQDASGLGPFKGDQATIEMDAALSGSIADGWHNATMATPWEEGLDWYQEHRCAATSPRDLVRWFPRRARQVLARHGYQVVRLEAPAGTAQKGRTQAVYNPACAKTLHVRPLGTNDLDQVAQRRLAA